MIYSYLDPLENVGIPPPAPNAGLYGISQDYKQNMLNNNRIEPDAVSFVSQSDFFAKNHIPTNIRPGNNTIKNNPYKFMDVKYNSMCYSR